MFKSILCLFLSLKLVTGEFLAYPDCTLRLRSPKAHLPIVFNGRRIIPFEEDPDGGWRYVLPRDETFTFMCTGRNNTFTYFGQRELTASCDEHGLIQTAFGEFSSEVLSCSVAVTESIEKVGTCIDNKFSSIHIQLDGQPFIVVCHDESRSETHYTFNYIDGPNLQFSESINRPSFKEGGFYPIIDTDQCYKQVEQLETVAQILQSQAKADEYIQINSQYFLSRGHLTPNADGIYAHEKRATFYFVNAVPQWQISNAGNWEKLESALRKYAEDHQVVLEVYTGATGVMTLEDVNGQEQPIYLGKDSSGQLMNVLPVPRTMYKVIINSATNQGAVVVQFNNPYAEFHRQEDIICPDVCDQLTWVTWDVSNANQGYTYCCDIASFHAKLPEVPYPGNLELMRT